MRAVPGERCAAIGAGTHGVFSPVSHVWGKRRRAPAAVRRVRGDRGDGPDRIRSGPGPAGVVDGTRIRVPEMGHVGPHGGASGDLYITVQVSPHPRFHREGDDLHLLLPVAIHEAALGARVDVPAIDGHVRLRVPPGTQSGQRFRLRGRGAPSARDGHQGDLVVEVRRDAAEGARRAVESVAARVRRAERRAGAGLLIMPTKRGGKAYYMISAVAQRYNIHPQTLRLYEREGLLRPRGPKATRVCIRKKIWNSWKRFSR